MIGFVYFLIVPAILTFIPVFYLYILSITTPAFRFKRNHLIHFMPAIIILCLNIPYLTTSSPERLDFISQGYSMSRSTGLFRYLLNIYMLGIFVFFTLQLATYALLAVKLYRGHKTYIESRYSYTENINLDWILILIICFVIFFIFNDIMYFLGFRQHIFTQLIYNIAMLSIILYIGYRGLLQQDLNKNYQDHNLKQFIIQIDSTNFAEYDSKAPPQVIVDKTIVNKDFTISDKIENTKKYSGSALTEYQKKVLISSLEHLMQCEKIFINEKLSIEDIALKLNTNTKYISQVINETYNINFYNYINSFRIEEARKLLSSEENEKYSILGIAQSVGFVSKSAFNVAFKRFSGLTPSEFKVNNSLQKPKQ